MNDIRLHLTLGSTPTTAQQAIERLDQALTRWNWGTAGSRADAHQVARELVDDATEHAGPAPELSLELARSGHRLRISVTDGSPGHRRSVDPAGHHGLHVVQAVASQWGSDRHPRGGTTVWCELIDIPEPRRPAPSEMFGIAA